MGSDREFVEYAAEQMKKAGEIEFKYMFGEYAIYCNKKVVALVCDNMLFVKPTESGRTYIGEVVEAPPYPGAKNAFLIEEQIEDSDWLSGLIKITEKELPVPRPKKRRKGK